MLKKFELLEDYENFVSSQSLNSGVVAYVEEDKSVHFTTNNIDGELKSYDSLIPQPFIFEAEEITEAYTSVEFLIEDAAYSEALSVLTEITCKDDEDEYVCEFDSTDSKFKISGLSEDTEYNFEVSFSGKLFNAVCEFTKATTHEEPEPEPEEEPEDEENPEDEE